MDIVERLQGAHWTDTSERLKLIPLAIDEIKRLRDDLKHSDEVRQSALQSLLAAETEIKRLRKKLEFFRVPIVYAFTEKAAKALREKE